MNDYLQMSKTDDTGEDEEEELDEETKRRDQVVRGAIDGLMREYAKELTAPSQDEESLRRKKKKERKEEVGDHLYCSEPGTFSLRLRDCMCIWQQAEYSDV